MQVTLVEREEEGLKIWMIPNQRKNLPSGKIQSYPWRLGIRGLKFG